MKLPRSDIYWNCIVGNYLTLHDWGRFENAINNHVNRLSLNLPFITSYKQRSDYGNGSDSNSNNNSQDRFSATPYSKITQLNTHQEFSITDETCISWCLNRKIFPKRVDFEFTPDVREDKDFTFFLNNIEYLKSSDIFQNVGFILADLKSLKSIKFGGITTSDLFVQGFLLQCIRNANRPTHIFPGPHKLEELSISSEELSDQMMRNIIESLPYLKSLEIIDMESQTVSDDHIEMITEKCLDLEKLDLSRMAISDYALCNLYRLCNLKHLSLSYCPYLTETGLTSVFDIIGPYLETLCLSSILTLEDELMRALRSCTRLRYLNIHGLKSRITPRQCSDHFLVYLSRNHPLLEVFIINFHRVHNCFTYEGMVALMRGCQNLRYVDIGSLYNDRISSPENYPFEDRLKDHLSLNHPEYFRLE